MNILIADDHVIVRGGLKQLFSLMGDVTVAGEATNGMEVIEMLQYCENLDLLLLDLTMPGISGVKLITRIRTQHKSLPILVLSMHNELQVAKRVFQAGASGFITKGSPQETLIAAIRKVAAGGRFVDPMLAEQMMFEKTVAGDVPHDLLSEREVHILKLFAQGNTVNEIAEKLFINSKTVSTHKARLMQKMNFQNNAELVRYAVDHDLVE
jgi:DNA-binding NarL/FixJ family response regulator